MPALETTFVKTAPVNGDDITLAGSYTWTHDTTTTKNMVATVTIFGSDGMDAMIDSAMAWAVVNKEANCHDEDSCSFFFDGYAMNINLSFTAETARSNIVAGPTHSNAQVCIQR